MSASFNPTSFEDTYPTSLVERDKLQDVDEFEDTQPSVVLPDFEDEFADAPTIPGFRLRADGTTEHLTLEHPDGHDGQWDRVLRAVAVAVKRVFTDESLD